MRSLLPPSHAPRLVVSRMRGLRGASARLDALLIFVPANAAAAALAKLPHGAVLGARLRRSRRSPGTHFCVPQPAPGASLAIIGLVPKSPTPFALLTLAGEMLRSACSAEARTLGVAAIGLAEEDARSALNSGVSAALAAAFHMPSFAAIRKLGPGLRRVVAFGATRADLARIEASCRANNIVRWLTSLPPDRLNPRSYRRVAESMVQDAGLRAHFFGEVTLARLGAGAFLAVARGSARRDAGILRLSYRPRGSAGQAPIALVGKGICFDTGGTNLKSHKSMLNMHTDMAGSAVALATLLALARLGFPKPVDAWLALAENRIGPSAYQPQEIVTAMNGTTIQVIHTDAEGRMVLADALALASRSRPATIIDLATLTGGCVGALTQRYSGGFTNRPAWRKAIEQAGMESGERVWCLPMDTDFDCELESKVADVIQCTVEAKGDHIYAARFLSRFVGAGIPWLHVDLSAASRSGGLAHVPTDITGFGVRFLLSLLLDQALPVRETASLVPLAPDDLRHPSEHLE